MVEPEHVIKQRQRVQRAKVQLAELVGPVEAQSQESGPPRRAGWRAGGVRVLETKSYLGLAPRLGMCTEGKRGRGPGICIYYLLRVPT